MDFKFNKDITYFAKTNFRGNDQIFGIKRKDRRQHMYLLGKSGTGKSVTLENMIIQNIHQGEGVCVVDPHGELVEKILETIPPERINDVIYFNPADTDFNIGFNVLQLDDPRYKHLVASGLMGIFTKIWANAWSSRMEYILNNTILALLDTPDTTLLGIPRMLVDKDYRQYIINNLKDPVVKAFWVHEYEAWRDQFRNEAIAPIQNKVGQFLSSNIVRNVVGQTRSTINIFDIMNSKKIFLVNVSKGRVGEDNSALLGGMLITKLQLSAMERVRIPENQREDFYLYVDEFQNFVTDSFASILSEARKYRLNLIIAHQYIAQLETADGSAVKDAVFGNVGTMVIFRVGADDADHLEKEFEPEFTVEDFVNLPNYHIYTKLMVDGVTSRPFSAKTLPPVQVASSEETREKVIETSRKLYTRERSVVENEIQKWSSTVPGSTRSDGEEAEGKFKAVCSNCGKDIYVPFEPEAGRPIYCKECLFKIKNGELEAKVGFRAPREKRDNISYDPLAALGIEFKAEVRAPARASIQASRPAGSFAANRPITPGAPRPAPVVSTSTAAPAPAAGTSTPPVVNNTPVPRPAPIPSISRPTPAQRPVSNQSDRDDLPPMGMIRADSRDMRPAQRAVTSGSSGATSQNITSDTLNSSDVSLPQPRSVKMPIKKERQGPDTTGLQNLLKSALSDVMGNSQASRQVSPAPEVSVQGTENEQQRSSVPTMSLDALKNKTSAHFVTPVKEALPERQNLLKDAVSKAIGEETIDSAISLDEEKIKDLQQQLDRKEEVEKEKQEAFERQEKERKESEEKIRIEMEKEKQRLEEERVAREKALAEVEARRKEEEQKAQEAKQELEAKLEQERQETARKERELEAERDHLAAELRAKDEMLHKEREAKRLEHEAALQKEKEKEIEAERERAAQEAADTKAQEEAISEADPTPVASKRSKEIPEDLLKQILE
jgi:CxxC-x17-CxxC domain-containing protein